MSRNALTVEEFITLVEHTTDINELDGLFTKHSNLEDALSIEQECKLSKHILPILLSAGRLSVDDILSKCINYLTQNSERALKLISQGLKTLFNENITLDTNQQTKCQEILKQLPPAVIQDMLQNAQNLELLHKLLSFDCIAITGPDNSNSFDALLGKTKSCVLIGDGKRDLLKEELNLKGLFSGKTILFLNGHGSIFKHKHEIRLSTQYDSDTSDLLSNVDSSTSEPAHILITSCYAGALRPSLKNGSEVVTIGEVGAVVQAYSAEAVLDHYTNQAISFAQMYVNSFSSTVDKTTFYHSLGYGKEAFRFVYRPFHNNILFEPSSAQILVQKAQEEFIVQYQKATGISLDTPPLLSSNAAEELLKQRFLMIAAFSDTMMPKQFLFSDTGLRKFITKDSEFGGKLLVLSLQNGLKNHFVIGRNLFGTKYEPLTKPETILNFGVDPNRPDKDGRLPLHIALDTYKYVKTLLEHGANPNLPNKEGDLPIKIAAQKLDLEVVEELLKHGANFSDAKDYLSNGEEILQKAKWLNCDYLIKALFVNHLINLDTIYHDKPLREVWKEGNINIVKLLIDSGRDPAEFPTADKMLKNFIDEGAYYHIRPLIATLKIDLAAIKIEGKSHVLYASEHSLGNKLKVIKTLMLGGAKIDFAEPGIDWNNVFLEVITKTFCHGKEYSDVVKAFIASGLNINSPFDLNGKTQTYTQYFAQEKEWGIVNALFENGAQWDLSLTQDEAKKIFKDCLLNVYTSIADAMLASKIIGPNTKIFSEDNQKDMKPLAHVVLAVKDEKYTEDNALDLVKILIKHGADPNTAGKSYGAKQCAEDSYMRKITSCFNQYEENNTIKNVLEQCSIDLHKSYEVLALKTHIDSLLLKEEVYLNMKLDTPDALSHTIGGISNWIDQVLQVQNNIETEYNVLNRNDHSWHANFIRHQHEVSIEIIEKAGQLRENLLR